MPGSRPAKILEDTRKEEIFVVLRPHISENEITAQWLDWGDDYLKLREWFFKYGVLQDGGKCCVTRRNETAEFPNLSVWVSYHRRHFKEGKLDHVKICLLDELSFTWSGMPGHESTVPVPKATRQHPDEELIEEPPPKRVKATMKAGSMAATTPPLAESTVETDEMDTKSTTTTLETETGTSTTTTTPETENIFQPFYVWDALYEERAILTEEEDDENVLVI